MTPEYHRRHERLIRQPYPRWQKRKANGKDDSWDDLSIEFRRRKKTFFIQLLYCSEGIFQDGKKPICMNLSLLTSFQTIPNLLFMPDFSYRCPYQAYNRQLGWCSNVHTSLHFVKTYVRRNPAQPTSSLGEHGPSPLSPFLRELTSPREAVRNSLKPSLALEVDAHRQDANHPRLIGGSPTPFRTIAGFGADRHFCFSGCLLPQESKKLYRTT